MRILKEASEPAGDDECEEFALFDRTRLVDGKTSLVSSCSCCWCTGAAPVAEAEDGPAAPGSEEYRREGCSFPSSFFGLPSVLLRLTILVRESLVETTVPPLAERLTMPGPPRLFCQRPSEGGGWTTLSDLLPRFTPLRCEKVLPASEALSLTTEDAMEGVRFFEPQKPELRYPPTSDMTSSLPCLSSSIAGAMSLNCTLRLLMVLLLPDTLRALLAAIVPSLDGLAGVKVMPISEAAEPRAGIEL